MMLAAGDLRATLVTIHSPSPRSRPLSIEKIVNAGLVTAQALRRDFGIAAPRLAVAWPQPARGRRRRAGREEIEIIVGRPSAPCATWASTPSAPSPADTLFHAEPRRATTPCCACTTTRP
jgi:4-hydroxythreonine-4-phosphate dehydrogenase